MGGVFTHFDIAGRSVVASPVTKSQTAPAAYTRIGDMSHPVSRDDHMVRVAEDLKEAIARENTTASLPAQTQGGEEMSKVEKSIRSAPGTGAATVVAQREEKKKVLATASLTKETLDIVTDKVSYQIVPKIFLKMFS